MRSPRRKELTGDAIRLVVQAEIAERRRAAADHERLGERDASLRLRAEAAIIETALRQDDAATPGIVVETVRTGDRS